MRRAGFSRVRARVGLEKVGFGLKSGLGLDQKYFLYPLMQKKKKGFYDIDICEILKSYQVFFFRNV